MYSEIIKTRLIDCDMYDDIDVALSSSLDTYSKSGSRSIQLLNKFYKLDSVIESIDSYLYFVMHELAKLSNKANNRDVTGAYRRAYEAFSIELCRDPADIMLALIMEDMTDEDWSNLSNNCPGFYVGNKDILEIFKGK